MSLVRRYKEIKEMLVQTYCIVPHQAILLSGGLDSSILASIIRPKHAITIGFGPEAEDFIFSDIVARRYCQTHVRLVLNHDSLLSIMNKLIGIMKTFDPIEIRNSCVIYAGIEESIRRGYTEILTGDGCDELFAGYDYMRRLDSSIPDLELELDRIQQVMHFSSHQIGHALGVTVCSPYLENPFFDYAQTINVSEKIGRYKGKCWGKFLLRKCFAKELGEGIAWRAKRAQERGANITQFTGVIEEAFDDDTYKTERVKVKKEGVAIRNKEHLYYYMLYRRMFPIPGTDQIEFKLRCPECGYAFRWNGSYCRTCGSYPVSPLFK